MSDLPGNQGETSYYTQSSIGDSSANLLKFECQHCEISFTQKTSLTQHMIQHARKSSFAHGNQCKEKHFHKLLSGCHVSKGNDAECADCPTNFKETQVLTQHIPININNEYLKSESVRSAMENKLNELEVHVENLIHLQNINKVLQNNTKSVSSMAQKVTNVSNKVSSAQSVKPDAILS